MSLPSYTVACADLEAGASLGNSALWVTTKATGAIEQIYVLGAGRALVGSVALRYGLRHPVGVGRPLPPARCPERPVSYVPLAQPSGTMELHPAYQRRRVTLLPSLAVTETTFLPLSGQPAQSPDAPLVYVLTTLSNSGAVPLDVRVEAGARLAGLVARPVCPRYDPSSGALVAHDRDEPMVARAFGCASSSVARWAAVADLGRFYDPQRMPGLDGHMEEGDVLGLWQVDVRLEPGVPQAMAFVLTASVAGEERALAQYRAQEAPDVALARTCVHLQRLVAQGRVLTPDPVINGGALWSKVNMRRVVGLYPQGWAFTNDPGHSSAVVGRDAAWFVQGCDYFCPAFSRALLEGLARAQEPSGKIPEYYHALDGHAEDDGLNINDDTPLFVLAVAHHYHCTGDQDWLAALYPCVEAAASWIIKQRDARGLVYCTATDPRGNVWASATWRNIIPQYSLNGAVTEINAEGVAALRAAASLAGACASPEARAVFVTQAQALRLAMDHHLMNKQTGLYDLHHDTEGVAHSDQTADLLFPLLFGACSSEAGARILSRLGQDDFWTAAGLRTASRHDPLYDPSGNVGLLGGVWPGVTWWLAMACARTHPQMMVRALRSSFAHYAANPRQNNTVPGQFSEWFDGESLVNRGMRLSPWEPPRFLWAAIEGVLGLQPQDGPPLVHPVLPPSWSWVAGRDLPLGGDHLSYCVVRQGARLHVYASALVQSDYLTEIYGEDVTAQAVVPDPQAAVLALRRPGDLLVFVGSSAAHTAVLPVDLTALLEDQRTYQARYYDSALGAWSRVQSGRGSDFWGLALVVEQGGFRLAQFRDDGVPLGPQAHVL